MKVRTQTHDYGDLTIRDVFVFPFEAPDAPDTGWAENISISKKNGQEDPHIFVNFMRNGGLTVTEAAQLMAALSEAMRIALMWDHPSPLDAPWRS